MTGGKALDDWCKSWMGSGFHKPLTQEGWFEEGLLPGVHVWAPPPAAALIALKQHYSTTVVSGGMAETI